MRDSKATLVAIWATALVIVAALLAGTGYRTRDPDSRAYITITTRLVDEPASRWIAPQWWGAWGAQGLFQEHPAGTFVLPALLARAGYPAAQSLFVVTLGAQIISLLTIGALASRLVPPASGRALVWALQLIPIAFVFRVRANQEYLVLAGLLVAVYGLERARQAWGWMAVAVVGALYALLVKGVFALLAPVSGALWLWSRRRLGAETWRAWAGVLTMVVMTPLVALLYERAYVASTGASFLDYYLGARMTLEGSATPLPFPIGKGANALWYLGRIAWYAAPWSVVALLALTPRTLRSATPGARAWVRFALLATIATVILVAARDTTADRYIFPAYFFAASAGVVVACDRWPRMAVLTERLDALWPWGPALLWLVLVTARIVL